jgi:hypothetical protein
MSNKLIIFVAYGGGDKLITPCKDATIIYKPYAGYSRGGGEFIDKVSQDYPDLIEQYEYVSFMGDDCEFKAQDMVDACGYGFHLFQLAMTRDSFYSWEHLRQQEGEYRHVLFIEMMFTMSVEFWRNNKHLFCESKCGWGLDFLLCERHTEQYQKQPVVFDRYAFRHTRPINSEGLIDGLSKGDEMYGVIHKYGLYHYHPNTMTTGGMSFAELALLRDICKGKKVLEVGSYLGESSSVIASVCESLTCVDIWDDSYNHVEQKQRSVYLDKQHVTSWDVFIQNCQEHIESGKITVIRSLSTQAKIEGIYDLVFIDADHSYEGVRDDIAKYRPHALMIAFHDYGGMWEGVKKAVDESGLTYSGHIGSLYCFTTRQSKPYVGQGP